MWDYRNSLTFIYIHCRDYVVRVGDAISQLINVVLFFSDNPNESISGRAYRQQENWFWSAIKTVIDWVFSPLQSDHCKKAYCADLMRARRLLGE